MSSIWLQLVNSGVLSDKHKSLFEDYDKISPSAMEIVNLLDSNEINHPGIIDILNKVAHELSANKGMSLEAFLQKPYLSRNKYKEILNVTTAISSE